MHSFTQPLSKRHLPIGTMDGQRVECRRKGAHILAEFNYAHDWGSERVSQGTRKQMLEMADISNQMSEVSSLEWLIASIHSGPCSQWVLPLNSSGRSLTLYLSQTWD